MFHSRIAAGPLTVSIAQGFAPGTRPIGFSFGGDDGPIRHAVCAAHAEDHAHCYIGDHSNDRVMDHATAAGLRLMDVGSSDSGSERNLGAVAGYAPARLLLGRHRLAAPPQQAAPHG